MFRYSTALLSVSAIAIGAALPVSVLAQTAETAVNEGFGLGDIVVTARRREESQQDVPVSITALSGEAIEKAGLRSTEDLRSSIPSVNIGGQRRNEAQFYIRGQGPGPVTTGQKNLTSVATYFAEVPALVAASGVFYDLQSVQVLKGPQGTLFGRNTTGGAVLFEPNHPLYENNGYIKATIGNYNYKELEVMLNVAPVADKVALRLAGQISRRNGYTRSIITGQDLDDRSYEALRISLRLNPTETIESTTIFDYRERDEHGGSTIFTAYDPQFPALGTVGSLTAPARISSFATQTGLTEAQIRGIPVGVGGSTNALCILAPTAVGECSAASVQAAFASAQAGTGGFFRLDSTANLAALLARQKALGIRQNMAPTLLRSKGLDWGITNKTSIDVSDNITLKNIVAFRRTRKNESADYDGTPLPFIGNLYTVDQPWQTGFDQFTEEFQVQGQIPSANIEYLAGLYYERVKTGFLQSLPGVTLAGAATLRRSNFKDTSKAVFAHVEWNPSDLFGITAGVRQTWDNRNLTFYDLRASDSLCRAPAGAIPSTATCISSGRTKNDALTYDATINFKPMDKVLLFAGFRHGYKSGGINLPAPAPQFSTFLPEEVDSFEVGLKADWDIGVPLRTNVSLFYDKYKSIQIGQPTVVPGSPPVNVVRNGIRAVNKGVEFEGAIKPIREFTLSGFFSYLDAAPTNTIVDVATRGRQFSFQPKWKYGVSGTLDIPVGQEIGELSATMNWSWQSEVFNANTPTLISVNPSYGLLNARIDWNNMFGQGFDLSLFATNLTNEQYVLGGWPISQLGFTSNTYGEPRMYGLSLKFRFGDK